MNVMKVFLVLMVVSAGLPMTNGYANDRTLTCALENARLPDGRKEFSVTPRSDLPAGVIVPLQFDGTPLKLAFYKNTGELETRWGSYSVALFTTPYLPASALGLYENGELRFSCSDRFLVPCFNSTEIEILCR